MQRNILRAKAGLISAPQRFFWQQTALFLCSLLLMQPVFCDPTPAYQYQFAVCAIFQHEAAYLKEWLEYHRLLGAQHFYLYNNSSQDHYLEVLQPYLAEGSVELIEWPDPDFQMSGQQKAYMDAIDRVRGKVKWLAIIDIDEYLVPKLHDSIPAFLAEFEEEGIGGVGINWQMFGTSFVPKIGERQLMTEELTLKAVEGHPENSHIKSIVRPEYVVEPAYIHHFDYKEGYAQVNSNREPFSGPFSPYIATDKIQINHYWTKDEDFFYETKVPRRQQWGESMESIEKRLNALNQVEDTSIARFIPPLRQVMFPYREEKFYSAETIPSQGELSDPTLATESLLAVTEPIRSLTSPSFKGDNEASLKVESSPMSTAFAGDSDIFAEEHSLAWNQALPVRWRWPFAVTSLLLVIYCIQKVVRQKAISQKKIQSI